MDVLCLCNVEARAPGQGPHSSNRSGPQVAGNWDQSGSDTHRGRTDSDASHAQHLLILDCWGLSHTLLRIINSGIVCYNHQAGPRQQLVSEKLNTLFVVIAKNQNSATFLFWLLEEEYENWYFILIGLQILTKIQLSEKLTDLEENDVRNLFYQVWIVNIE